MTSPSNRSLPPHRPWATPPAPAPAPQPQWVGPPVRRFGQPGVGTAVALVVLSLLLLVAVGVIGATVGTAALPGAALLALLPLAVVLLTVRWVDRWEREPWQALAVAFGWGASVAVLVALVLNTGAQLVLYAAGSSTQVTSVVGAAVVAPVVEESIKALGVLLLFLAWRRSFDGPVDGLVYAATVAAGFAFVENILYFGRAMVETAGQDGAVSAVVTVFMMRAVMSPFAHVLFTACVGLALGLAARSGHRRAWLWALPVGLLAAIVLHGLWNGSAMMSTEGDFFVVYGLFQVPFFLAMFAVTVWLRRQEAAVIRVRLSEYSAAGWLAPAEVTMLTSLRERRGARAWAAARGGRDARRAMHDLQQAATRLAYQRQRIVTGRADDGTRHDEAALLAEVAAARRALVRAVAV